MTPRVYRHDVGGLAFPCRLGVAEWMPQGEVAGTVVALHGLSRQKRDFDDMGAYLAARGFRVLAVDAPGRGDSSWLPGPEHYHLANYAGILSAFLMQQNTGPVHWVGTSMGGLIALTMAQLGMGGFFRSVTFVDITHRPNPAACARIAGYMTVDLPVLQSPAQYLPLLRANLPLGDVPDHVWERFAASQLVRAPDGYHFHFDPNIVPMAKQQLSQPIDLTAGLLALACPVALVAGEISDLCTADEISAFTQLRPDAQVLICPGAGHIPALYSEAENSFIYRFVSSAR